MASRTPNSRGRRPAVPEGLNETWAKDLTDQFRRTLSTKRMNALTRNTTQQHQQSPNAPPSYSSLRNIPLVATA
ncbi:hypothetical protein KCV04_g16087, partial [Aureobasidium melanogenum]